MIHVKIDSRTGLAYFSKGIRKDGFIGEVECLSTALTLTLIKPGASLADIETSLKILLQDLELKRHYQERAERDKETGGRGY